MIASRLARLHEPQGVYDTEDLYDLLEIAAVDACNRMTED